MSLGINELDLFIGKQIRFFRKRMNWGLKTLASKLNISIQQLQKYETGQNKVSASMLWEVKQAFEISIDVFFQPFTEIGCTTHSKNSFNVLLIEDNLDEEFLIREAIRDFSQPMELYVVHDTEKTLDFLNALGQTPFKNPMKPDIILLELHLAHAVSLDLLKSIKRDKHLNSVPIILLSNTTNHKEIELSYNLNAAGLIIKSPAQEEFKAQIHDLLNYWSQLVTLPQDHHQ